MCNDWWRYLFRYYESKTRRLNTIFVNSKGIKVNSNIGIVVSSVEEISPKLITRLEKELDLER